MYLIEKITDDPYQKQTFNLYNGNQFTMVMRFSPMMYTWFIDSITYTEQNKTFTLNGIRIFNSPNMLHQWRNQIPFGLACVSTNQREPSQQKDFLSLASQLYILNADETQAFTDYLANG